MEASKLEMCKSLVEWFEVVTKDESQTGSEPDLSDGVAMARALHKFAPDFFTGKEALSQIPLNVEQSMLLKRLT